MTSTNIHKIVRRNLKAKPWMISKNTSEIVNSCITNIYNQMPLSFKNGLKQIKVASPRETTVAPVRNLLSHDYKKIKNSSKFLVESKSDVLPKREKIFSIFKHGRKTVLPSSKQITVDNITSTKKLLKAPTYKIYKNRPFASSTNSSRSSIFQHNNTYLKYSGGSIRSKTLKYSINDFIMAPRNQTMKDHTKATSNSMQISSVIQNELMSVNKLLQKRIAVRKFSKPVNTTTNPEIDHFKMWKHPPAFDQFRDTMLISNALNHNKGKPKKFKEQQRPNFSINTKPMLFHNRPLLGEPRGRIHEASKTTDVNDVLNVTRSDDISSNRQSSLHFAKQDSVATYNFVSSNDQAIKQSPNTSATNPASTSHNHTKPNAKEIHRRTRMKKLGLIEYSPQPSKTEIYNQPEYSGTENENDNANNKQIKYNADIMKATIAKDKSQTHAAATKNLILRKVPSSPNNPPNNTGAHDVNANSSKQGIFNKDNISSMQSNFESNVGTNAINTLKLKTADWQQSPKMKKNIINLAPLAATMASTTTVIPFRSYRYNRSNYLNIKKY